MKQSEINDYKKALDTYMTQYLASNPDPEEKISDYIAATPELNDKIYPVEGFDVAAMTALIRSHKDEKNLYNVHACTIELLVTMFRIANEKLHWLDDNDAYNLAGYLSYDKRISKSYIHLLDRFVFCITRFPHNYENSGWYACLMPIFAYSRQYDFVRTNYLVRYLLGIIDKHGILMNRGEHVRDIHADALRCIPTLEPLMQMCQRDHRLHTDEARYNYYKNVITEYAIVYLACLMQRSATVESFGTIAKEIVATHHIEYQLLAHEYFKQKTKESLNL